MRLTRLALLVLVLLCGCRPAKTQTGPVVVAPGELQGFADKFFAQEMARLRIPGLVFVSVQGGNVVHAEGYGYANLEEATPVDPETSVMAIGSISKPFVAVAVMQLVEQGKLDLHADVNQYLKTFQLQPTFREPVTLAHLLTHTSGIEDPPYERTPDPQQVQPLGEYLAAHLGPRVRPPGEAFGYSSQGYDLAAYIVEEVSGLPFDRYVAQSIFRPLRMEHSRYVLPLPLPENLATGYFYEDRVQVAQPLDYDSGYPSGSVLTTAPDMARFMLALLGGGCYGDTCILRPETMALMQQKQAATPDEGQNQTFGFVEGLFEGGRIVGHSGATRGFGSILTLFPEHDLGFFFSFNEECWQTSACDIILEFRKEFLKRFLP